MINLTTSTVWWALAQPGAHPKKLSLPLETTLALLRTTTTEASFRAEWITLAEVSDLTPTECLEIAQPIPALRMAATR